MKRFVVWCSRCACERWFDLLVTDCTSIGRRVYITVMPDGDVDGGVEEVTCTNEKPFTATLYFKDIGSGAVNLSFKIEGDKLVDFKKLSAHSATGAMIREFGNGAVF